MLKRIERILTLSGQCSNILKILSFSIFYSFEFEGGEGCPLPLGFGSSPLLSLTSFVPLLYHRGRLFVKYFFSFFSTFFRCRLAEAENTRLKQLLTKLRDLLPQPHGGFHKDICRGFTTLLTLPSIGIFIIPHSVEFVKRFFQLFLDFFSARGGCPPLTLYPYCITL